MLVFLGVNCAGIVVADKVSICLTWKFVHKFITNQNRIMGRMNPAHQVIVGYFVNATFNNKFFAK